MLALSFYSESWYRRKQSEITKANWQKGKYFFLIKPKEIRSCKNSLCNNSFKVKPYNPKKFCSISCAAIYNNTGKIHAEITKRKISISLKSSPKWFRPPLSQKGIERVPRVVKLCQNCGEDFKLVPYLAKTRKYCSNACAIHRIGSQSTSPKAARSKSGIRSDIDPKICFYSRWEANIARLLNYLKIRWEFGTKNFDLKQQIYRPDFYLPDYDLYIEVKNFLGPYSRNRTELFRKLYPTKKFILILKEDYRKLETAYADILPNWEFDSNSKLTKGNSNHLDNYSVPLGSQLYKWKVRTQIREASYSSELT